MKQIKRSRWNDSDLFQCPYCRYNSTLSEEAVRQHMLGAHSDAIRLDELAKAQRKEDTAVAAAVDAGVPVGERISVGSTVVEVTEPSEESTEEPNSSKTKEAKK